jgi:pimeloyl-ACP methyl ester carboxylesterase
VGKIQSNGLSLYYEAFGNPSHPAILLIMGLASQSLNWFPYFIDSAGRSTAAQSTSSLIRGWIEAGGEADRVSGSKVKLTRRGTGKLNNTNVLWPRSG